VAGFESTTTGRFSTDRRHFTFIRRSAIVQKSLSLTVFFGLICFGVIRFLCIVGTDGIHSGTPAIDKGRFSDNRSRNMP
jgi:hypothetical protein